MSLEIARKKFLKYIRTIGYSSYFSQKKYTLELSCRSQKKISHKSLQLACVNQELDFYELLMKATK